MRYNPDTHHRRSVRLTGYDYSKAGLYFITIYMELLKSTILVRCTIVRWARCIIVGARCIVPLLVQVGGTAIRGCIACEKCFKNQDNQCSVKKDKFNGIFSKMLKADAMILGSPTYFAAVSADLKALIKRAGFVAYANNNSFSGKIGAAVVAVRRG